MKELYEYKDWLNNILENNLEDEKMEFVWSIIKSPYVEFHYELLKNQQIDARFRRHLLSRFDEHGIDAEDFLISKLDNNEDIEFQGEIIFLLGKMNKKYQSKILEYAQKLTQSDNDYTRDRAIIVLGWIGNLDDIKILKQHLLTDKNPKCRAWSASSYMQMWFRNENETLKQAAFNDYRKALFTEEDDFVISIILSAIRAMGKTKLGISQTALDDLDTEKINLAKIKAIRYLEKNEKQNNGSKI